jgi:uncharacterized protein YkwD
MHRSSAAALPLVLLLAACGSVDNAFRLPKLSAPAAGGAPVSATGTPGNVTGQVLDLSTYSPGGSAPGWSVLASGQPAQGVAPVKDAVVVVGPALESGATALQAGSNGDTSTTTDAQGKFSLTASAGTQYLMVFPGPRDRVHTAAIHRVVTLGSGANPLPALLMAAVTSDEAAWLERVNSDRAANGAAPVVLDESLLESARYWSNFMAHTGYFAHCVPASACTPGDTATPPPSAEAFDANPGTRDAYFGAAAGLWGENIAAGFATWSGAEGAFMAEKSLCPGATYSGCSFGETTGHFLNIVDPTFAWVGLAEAHGGVKFGSYYDQEFGSPGTPSSPAEEMLRLSPPLTP